MPRLDSVEFVCIDCETTGLDAQNDQIIEVAAVCFTLDSIGAQFESLINPGCPIPESSTEIHNITNEMVMGKPTMAEVLPELLKVAGDRILIGHGIGFDIEVVALAADRARIPCTLRTNPSLDTLRMARLYGESPVNSLEQLRRHFNIGFEGPHRAMNDVIVNIEVFKYLAKNFRTTEQIFEALSRPIAIKIMPLGKHKGRPIKEVPLEYLLRAANGDYDRDLLYSIRSEINRRKKGNLFSQSINPFADL